MIIKDHDQPLKLWKLEALVERLVQELQVFSEVEEAVKIARAGDRGERSIDYYVDLIDSNDLKVFYDLRLPYRQYHFQVDTLLMTCLFILLIEIKNIAGLISFNKESKQMIRTLQDVTESYPDPLLQVLQQKFQLDNFIRKHGFPQIPIFTLVCSVNRSGILQIDPQDTFHLGKVIPVQEFIFKYQALRKKELTPILGKSQMDRLSEIFLESHTPYDEDVLNKFHLSRNHIMNGVACPNCRTLGMKREWGTWVCLRCGAKSNDAHLKALRDYALLFGESITNKEAREFLGVESRHVIRRLMLESGILQIGDRKSTYYDLSGLIRAQMKKSAHKK